MNIERVRQLAKAVEDGDIDRCVALTSQTWPDPADRPTEASPAAHWRTLGAGLAAALGDREVEISDVEDDDGEIRARVTVSARFTGDLWGSPCTGAPVSMTATLVARSDGERLQWYLADWHPIALLRDLGVVPQPEFMDRPMAYPVTLPESVLKWAFNGGFLEKPCAHVDQIAVTEPESRGCPPCDEAGVEYPATRMCLICGHVGCCDAAQGKHALQHYEQTGHALIRSLQRSETWMWCYEDKTILSAKW